MIVTNSKIVKYESIRSSRPGHVDVAILTDTDWSPIFGSPREELVAYLQDMRKKDSLVVHAIVIEHYSSDVEMEFEESEWLLYNA